MTFPGPSKPVDVKVPPLTPEDIDRLRGRKPTPRPTGPMGGGDVVMDDGTGVHRPHRWFPGKDGKGKWVPLDQLVRKPGGKWVPPDEVSPEEEITHQPSRYTPILYQPAPSWRPFMEPIRWPTTVWQPGWESSPVVDFVVQHADALQKACLGVALAAGIGATGGLLLGLLGAGEAAGAGALIFAL